MDNAHRIAQDAQGLASGVHSMSGLPSRSLIKSRAALALVRASCHNGVGRTDEAFSVNDNVVIHLVSVVDVAPAVQADS
jgi:hypothetical protein